MGKYLPYPIDEEKVVSERRLKLGMLDLETYISNSN